MDKGHATSFEQFFLRVFLEETEDLMFIKDRLLRYVGMSKKFSELLGFNNPSDMIGKNIGELLTERFGCAMDDNDRKVIETGIPAHQQVIQVASPDKGKLYISLSKYPITGDDGEIIGMYGIGRDITEQMTVGPDQNIDSERMLDDVIEVDLTQDRILHVDGSIWSETLKLRRGCMFSKTVSAVAESMVKQNYRDEFINRYSIIKLREDYNTGIKQFSHIFSLGINGENYRWIEFTAWLYHSDITGTLRMMLFLRDLDEEIRDRERLRKRAETDPLTGLLNRDSAIEEIKECISGYDAQRTHALLFIDLDHYKQINDTMGHPFGDQVLMDTGETLRGLVRKSDIVGRMGGDEFIVLLKNVTSRSAVEARIRSILNAPVFSRFSPEGTRFSCSIGVSFFHGPGKSFSRLYEEADRAMYEAKQRGRGRAVFYEDLDI